jgi:predicted CXXCH cytochrome family protein
MRFAVNSATLALLAIIPGLLLGPHPSYGARENADCLQCHGDPSILEQGSMALYVDPVRFNDSSHQAVGCASCHASVSVAHPSDGSKPSRVSCQICHGPLATQYGSSLHAKNARCVDCHNPHRARKLLYVSGVEVNAICANCHGEPETVRKHGAWLPQAGLHLDSLPCITCHTGSQNYLIDLFIERKDARGRFALASYAELGPRAGEGGIPFLVDRNGDGFISEQELREFNGWARGQGMRLRGVMMPQVMTHSFQILANRRDCTFCHVSRSRTVLTSFVSFPTDSGRYQRVPVQKGALLDFFQGTPDFYMTGATRSKALSVVGALVVLCGLIMPVGHGLLRYLTRGNRVPEVPDPSREVAVLMQPTAVRIWHWINALSVVTLCLTGAQIRFPDTVNLFGSYQSTVYLHNTAGLTLAVFMAFWTVYYVAISQGIGKIYFLTPEELQHGLLRQAVYYFFSYFRGRPNPFHATPQSKFNALQKMAYLAVMLVFMPLVSVTGVLLLDIGPLRTIVFTLGGIKLIDGVHFLSACSLCAFVFTHFYLTTLGPTPLSEIRTMWSGWEQETKPEAAVPGKPEAPSPQGVQP